MDLEQKINELFDNTPEYINGVSFGFKKTNGKDTNELSIIFHLDKKKSVKDIPENELIPKTININGKNYTTDVVESSIIKSLACYNISDNNLSLEVLPHRSKQRPVKCGTVIVSTNNCGYNYDEISVNKIKPYRVGTLGCIVVDNNTNTLVGLTAGHVLSREILKGNLQEITPLSTNIIYPQKLRIIDKNNNLTKSQSENFYAQEIYQYTESSGNINILSNDAIGIPKKYALLTNTGTNYIDAGIFTLNKNVVSFTGSNLQLGLTGTLNMPFATNDEIYDIFSNQYNVYSAGRTTGPKDDRCNLKIKSLYSSKTISGYYLNDNLVNIYFRDLIGFGDTSNLPDPSSDGDSGAILYADHSGQNKIIGLVFAGSETGTNWAYACNINRIISGLNISQWTGDTKNFDNPKNKRGFITSITGGNIDSIYNNQDGLTYYQAGIALNLDAPGKSQNFDNSFQENTVFNNDNSITINPYNYNIGENDPMQKHDIFLHYLIASLNDPIASVIYVDGLVSNLNINDEEQIMTYDYSELRDAEVICKVEFLDSSCDCCSENPDINCSIPKVIGGHIYRTKTDFESVFQIEISNFLVDTCARIKILDIVKPGYNFRPDLSVKNELIICAKNTEVQLVD